ncbi:MAG: type II toxin-antitoxin system VapC family toxin [Treponema sp.]|nr:type II toxin-antitoxin system VapC family toxin [Treponema sp.]
MVKKARGLKPLWKNMKKIDANIVLRYLMNDHTDNSPKAKEIIEKNSVEIPIEVLCEVVYVLTGYYRINRQNVSNELNRFFESTNCNLAHREAVLKGLEYFGKHGLDFVDCILAGYADIDKDEIFTFDDKLIKLMKNK